MNLEISKASDISNSGCPETQKKKHSQTNFWLVEREKRLQKNKP